MKFYRYFRSSAAYPCRIVFNLKGVTPDFVPVHLRKGEQRGADFLAKSITIHLRTNGAGVALSTAEEVRAFLKPHIAGQALSLATLLLAPR